MSQSPDEDSLSSDAMALFGEMFSFEFGLNPLTKIHCLPTTKMPESAHSRLATRLNPLTRIHCLPTRFACLSVYQASYGAVSIP